MPYTTNGTKDGVARVIRQQIDFWAFAEVGAHAWGYDRDSLYFTAKPLHRNVRIVVTLDPSDTYTVRVVNPKTGADIRKYEGIYADQLSDVIRDLPGALQGGKA